MPNLAYPSQKPQQPLPLLLPHLSLVRSVLSLWKSTSLHFVFLVLLGNTQYSSTYAQQQHPRILLLTLSLTPSSAVFFVKTNTLLSSTAPPLRNKPLC